MNSVLSKGLPLISLFTCVQYSARQMDVPAVNALKVPAQSSAQGLQLYELYHTLSGDLGRASISAVVHQRTLAKRT